MKSNGHWDEVNEEFYVSILANPNTMKAILNIENNYQVNFKSGNSLRKLLGFNSKTYSASQESERVVVDRHPRAFYSTQRDTNI